MQQLDSQYTRTCFAMLLASIWRTRAFQPGRYSRTLDTNLSNTRFGIPNCRRRHSRISEDRNLCAGIDTDCEGYSVDGFHCAYVLLSRESRKVGSASPKTRRLVGTCWPFRWINADRESITCRGRKKTCQTLWRGSAITCRIKSAHGRWSIRSRMQALLLQWLHPESVGQ